MPLIPWHNGRAQSIVGGFYSVLRNPRDGTTRRRHRHGRSPHAPGEWGGVRHPPFFWLVWQHFPGTPVCMKSPPTGDGATAVVSRLGRLTPAPVPGGGGVTVSARPGRTPRWLPPSEGSRRRLAHHAPLYQSPSFPTGGRGMKSLCTGSSRGEPAPPGRVLTPPQSEACPE